MTCLGLHITVASIIGAIPNNDGEVTGFRFFDGEDERWVSTDLETFARAMVERATERGLSFAEFMDGEFDADDADIVVQKALFGKVIYG